MTTISERPAKSIQLSSELLETLPDLPTAWRTALVPLLEFVDHDPNSGALKLTQTVIDGRAYLRLCAENDKGHPFDSLEFDRLLDRLDELFPEHTNFTDIMDQALESLAQMNKLCEVAGEQHIEDIMELYLAKQPVSSVDQSLQVENARMRAAYLQDTPLFTAAEINELSGLSSANPSEPASRWKRDQRIFAVRRGGLDLYPAFQFVDGEPRPVIREILRALPADLSPWQIAFWFATGSGLLDGNAPEDSLSDSRVGEAAQFANQGPVG